jgi:predicted dehydrogenase
LTDKPKALKGAAMKTLRTAVVGLKGMGRGHLNELAQNPRASLTAVADIDAESAASVAAQHGARSYSDYRALLEKEGLDAVVFATPHHLHAPMALDALAAGLHVFVEKPIAIRVSEADRMVEAAAAKERVLAVGHNYRTFPANLKLKALLPQLGSIHRILWQWLENRPESYYDRDIWRATWRHAGGGVLMNQTSHDLDLMCWLFGAPAEVSSMVINRGHKHEVEDTAIANIRFASGALANVQLSTVSHRLNYRQIAGDKGTILMQDETNANVQVPQVFRLGRYDRPVSQIITDTQGATGQPQPDWEEIDCADAASPTLLASFVDACLDGGAPITDGDSARTTLELINAIILSGVRKKVVALPLDRDEYDALMDELISGKVKVSRG